MDTAAVIERKRIEHTADLHVSGRDIEGRKLGMAFDSDDLSGPVEGDADTFQMSEIRQAIYDALEGVDGSKGPMCVSERVDVRDDTIGKRWAGWSMQISSRRWDVGSTR